MQAATVISLPKKETLSSQVARYLLDLIARDRLTSGDLAPSEVKICRDLNVSRGIVREAYRSLATLGILEIESGKSPRVRGLNSSVLTQIVGFALRTAHITAPQVLQLRRAVEVEAARLAAEHGTSAQFERLQDCVAQMRDARTEHRGMIMADVALHTTVAEATGNPLFPLMIEGLHGPLEESMSQGLKSRRTRQEVLRVPEIHRTLVDRICARDGEGAAKAMALHFDVAVSAILAAGVAAQASLKVTGEGRGRRTRNDKR